MALVVFVVYAAAGWYFSEELRRDALETAPSEDEPTVEVIGMDGGQITLAQGDPEDDELTAPGTFGLSWDGGYGRVTGILEEEDDEVVRRFTAVERGRPETGTLTDVDPTTFPRQPLAGTRDPLRGGHIRDTDRADGRLVGARDGAHMDGDGPR